MARPVVAGVDGSPESLAAADWAAHEAQLRGTPLVLKQAWQWPPARIPNLADDDMHRYHAERILRTAAGQVRRNHPGLSVEATQVPRPAVDGLLDAAEEADVLALGSRGLSGVTGILLGSVGLATASRSSCPVVLVRPSPPHPHRPDAGGTTPGRRVVVGVDLRRHSDELLEFAFDAAARRRVPLMAVNAWRPPLPYSIPLSGPATPADAARLLTTVLGPWQEKYPKVHVVEDVATGSSGSHLLAAAADAALLVVGRRTDRPPLGARLGPVAHAVLHHARCPVAVVAHA